MTRTTSLGRAFCAALLLAPALAGCVQPAYDRTVIYRVDVSKVSDVQSVGVRGRGGSLSWDRDVLMTPVADSAGLYEAVVTHRTGALTTEVKFTVNGTFELANADNRTVRWTATRVGNDTMVYRAVFNVP